MKTNHQNEQQNEGKGLALVLIIAFSIFACHSFLGTTFKFF